MSDIFNYWNFRLIKFKDDIEICRVYYRKEKPYMFSPNMTVLGDSPKEIKKILRLMKKATRKPILSYKIFKNKEK